MQEKDKFIGFKKELVEKNENEYGIEIRETYGNKTIDLANQKLLDLTKEKMKELEETQNLLFEQLAYALKGTKIEEELEANIFELYKKWLKFYWPKYEKQAHFGLIQMYLADERFRAYYDEKIGIGATVFLCQSVQKFTQED